MLRSRSCWRPVALKGPGPMEDIPTLWMGVVGLRWQVLDSGCWVLELWHGLLLHVSRLLQADCRPHRVARTNPVAYAAQATRCLRCGVDGWTVGSANPMPVPWHPDAVAPLACPDWDLASRTCQRRRPVKGDLEATSAASRKVESRDLHQMWTLVGPERERESVCVCV